MSLVMELPGESGSFFCRRVAPIHTFKAKLGFIASIILPETNISPEMGLPNRKLHLPTIFRDYVSFREGIVSKTSIYLMFVVPKHAHVLCPLFDINFRVTNSCLF